MEEENLQNNTEDTGLMEGTPEELSVTDAMVGIITEPGETYQSISDGPKKNYWLAPTLVFMVISLISVFIVSLDPELIQAKLDEQMGKSRERIEEQVEKGNMTREQADKNIEMQESMMKGPFGKIMAYVGSVFSGFIIVFVLGLIYFIGFKILKSPAGYMDAVNIVGLALIISCFQQLIGAVLSILMGKLTGVGLGLILSEESLGTTLYTLLASIDVFSIWFYIVVSIGLMRIGKLRPVQAYGMAFGLWIIWTILISFVANISFG